MYKNKLGWILIGTKFNEIYLNYQKVSKKPVNLLWNEIIRLNYFMPVSIIYIR